MRNKLTVANRSSGSEESDGTSLLGRIGECLDNQVQCRWNGEGCSDALQGSQDNQHDAIVDKASAKGDSPKEGRAYDESGLGGIDVRNSATLRNGGNSG